MLNMLTLFQDCLQSVTINKHIVCIINLVPDQMTHEMSIVFLCNTMLYMALIWMTLIEFNHLWIKKKLCLKINNNF